MGGLPGGTGSSTGIENGFGSPVVDAGRIARAWIIETTNYKPLMGACHPRSVTVGAIAAPSLFP